MPCYRCGVRQVDPEPGKPSPYHRGVVDEHQVLICPACQTAALADLTRCARCRGVRLIRRLDQIECLDCQLVKDAGGPPGRVLDGDGSGGDAPGGRAPGGGDALGGHGVPGGADPDDISGRRDSALAAEVARALERMRGTR
jgi:hypothetical protein